MKNSFFALTWIFFFFVSSLAFAWTGQVVSVTDGDTIKVLRDGRETKIRLYGVDTPEKKQAFGQKAKDFTASLVAGKIVEVEPVDQDRYGRTVGLVTVAGKILSAELVKNGFAWGVPTILSAGRMFRLDERRITSQSHEDLFLGRYSPGPPVELEGKKLKNYTLKLERHQVR